MSQGLSHLPVEVTTETTNDWEQVAFELLNRHLKADLAEYLDSSASTGDWLADVAHLGDEFHGFLFHFSIVAQSVDKNGVDFDPLCDDRSAPYFENFHGKLVNLLVKRVVHDLSVRRLTGRV